MKSRKEKFNTFMEAMRALTIQMSDGTLSDREKDIAIVCFLAGEVFSTEMLTGVCAVSVCACPHCRMERAASIAQAIEFVINEMGK